MYVERMRRKVRKDFYLEHPETRTDCGTGSRYDGNNSKRVLSVQVRMGPTMTIHLKAPQKQGISRAVELAVTLQGKLLYVQFFYSTTFAFL
jgi:hypothetical protein